MEKDVELRQRLIDTLRAMRWNFLRISMLIPQSRLARKKADQVVAFLNHSEKFLDLYEEIKKYDISRFVTKPWQKYNARIENALLPKPPFGFFKDQVVMETMFVTRGGKCLKEELSYLEKHVPKEKLKVLLEEDYVGDPLLFNSTYLTSHNSIHLLYHWIRYLNETNSNTEQLNTIVEWGGGYGNMAKLFLRLKESACTYVIIDTPLFSCLQQLYLSSILGSEKVNIIKNANEKIVEGKINILPLCFVDSLNVTPDIFVSTWALSESSVASQDYVVEHNWFNAKKLLLAYQHSDSNLPDADRVGKLSTEAGAKIEKIDFLPGNYYSFL